MVEINDGGKNLTKAVIKRLTAKDVSQLTDKPEISLEQFHQLLEKSKTDMRTLITEYEKSNFKSEHSANISDNENETDVLLSKINLSPLDEEILKKKFEEENAWEVIEHETENVDTFPGITSDYKRSPTTVKDRKAKMSRSLSKKGKSTESNLCEQLKSIQKFNENLASYIELCVQCDFLNVGLETLYRYYKIQKFGNSKVKLLTNSRPYDILLHGFAAKGNVNKILAVMRLMANSEVSFTPQTFAACFECCGRLTSLPEHTNLLTVFHKQLVSHGFKFQDLFSKCIYVRDQRECVLKAINVLDKNFVPQYETEEVDYSHSFLQKLNKLNHVYHSPVEKLVSEHELNSYIKHQMDIELQTYQRIKSVMKPQEITPRMEHFREKWNELENAWKETIKNAFIKNLNQLEFQQLQTKTNETINVLPYLKVLSPEVYVDVIMMEINKLLIGSETYTPYLKILQRNLGKCIKNRYNMKFKQQTGFTSKISKIYRDYCKWYLHPETNTNSANARHQWQQLCFQNVTSGPTLMNPADKYWPPEVTLEVGKFLYNIIINDVKINVNAFSWNKSKFPRFVPAFYSIFRYQGVYLIEELKPSPVLTKLFKETHSDYITFDVTMLPMLSPPVPWTNSMSGGYIYTQADFMRILNSPINPIESTPNKQIYPVFDALNQLSAVPWKINEPVLDIMIKIFRDGGSKKLNIPLSVSSFTSEKNSVSKLNLHQRMNLNREKTEMYSLWCESLYRLSLANYFRKRIFWLPHNIDFRGRVYPIPPYLSHVSCDAARALLLFAKGQKLGPEGLDWLKIHCINLTGLKKKESIAERLHYANTVLPEILDSAENPLTGRMWWAQSEEDIWQILACCMEIRAALNSGDPENFVSHFPIHQDGSCNGLQHYAALGRDKEGGASVNLTIAEKPQDVYSCVVALVEEQRKIDAQNGIVIAQNLEGFIKRKVIKQTIMTTVYGVTKFGARLQIAKQLKDTPDFPHALIWPASLYLVTKTFTSLQEMFSSTKEIQDWFTDCAKIISGSLEKLVEWETPLGLPIIQPYFKHKRSSNTSSGSSHLDSTDFCPITMKQRNAFPPNFIHSLDSCHMMLTSLHCEREGITFVSVHDCFWTHPCSVNTMNKICREQFLNLHSLPILENLSDYFKNKYIKQQKDFGDVVDMPGNKMAKITFSRIPKKGQLNLKEVLKSQYFFS